MRSTEATLLYLSLSQPQIVYLWKSDTAKIKGGYAAQWRNWPPSACSKSVRYIKNEYIKDSTTGEKADVDTFIIIEANRTQRALYTVYENV